MIAAHSFKNKNVALFGLGGSGLVTARSLIAGGANLLSWDDNPAQVEASREMGIPTQDLRSIDWGSIDSFVLAPGVPLTHPKPHWSVELALSHGVEIIGDIEIFVRERNRLAPDSQLIAITGTNGKSTTTALISHIVASSGLDIQMGGNIGTAVLSLDEPTSSRVYVIECSSYQIDLAPSLNPTAGILLNLSPDHLDRHGSMEHYASVKERLVSKSEVAIIGVDDNWCQSIYGKLLSDGVNCQPVSVERKMENGLYLSEGEIVLSENNATKVLANISNISTLKGRHNAQNTAAALAACITLGLDVEQISDALVTFPGLKHRMQPVGRLGDVIFINDSKATNAEAAAPALKSYHDIFWIVGGLAKEGGITPLEPLFERVAKAYLIGEAAPAFAAELGDSVEFEIANTIDLAVSHAVKDTADFQNETGRVPSVLLSPACASFDQFRNFEIRGDVFVENVAAIEGIEMLIPYDYSTGNEERN